MDERESSLDIYDIRVALRKSFDGEKTARVYIRYSKKGKTVKKDFPWPEKVDESGLLLRNMGKEMVASYQRRGNLEYYDSKWEVIPTDLAQRLEPLVHKALK